MGLQIVRPLIAYSKCTPVLATGTCCFSSRCTRGYDIGTYRVLAPCQPRLVQVYGAGYALDL